MLILTKDIKCGRKKVKYGLLLVIQNYTAIHVITVEMACTIALSQFLTVSPSGDKQADIIGALTLHPDIGMLILNIANTYFDNMVNQLYPSKLQLNKANTSITDAFLFVFVRF